MSIMTVHGEISKELLGKTYIHEHLSIDLSSQKKDADTCFDNKDELIQELKALKKLGINSLVEVTNIGMGRDIERIREISQSSGIQVIVSTGFYKEPFYPEYVNRLSEKQLAKIMISDIINGIDESGVHAHVIGEIGTSHNKVEENEKKVLKASIRAHLETGRPISTHTTLGTLGDWQVAFMKKEGVDMNKVIIGHLGLNAEDDYLEKIADFGCFLGFDTIGKISYQSDEKRAKAIKNLIDKGHINQIVLSQDLTRKSHLTCRGGIGYSYLMKSFIPTMKKEGITQDQIEKMLVDNPSRVLDI